MSENTTSQQQAERSVLRKVLPYLWPEGDTALKTRVVGALLLLVLAKVITLITPLFFRGAVDALAPEDPSAQTTFLMLTGPVALVIGFGFARSGQVLFAQLRDAVFARVGQQALRKLALQTFQHIHALSMRYHMSRKTGGLSRIIERGVKGVDFLLRFVLFSIGPLIVELTLMAAIFWVLFGIWYAVIVLVTIFVYTVFTFKVTEWRVAIRRRMNEADTEANQKSIDSLLNFETVKYFGAERREAERYDSSMAYYEKEAIKTSYSLSALNFGQSVIITVGLVTVLVMAALDVQAGNLSVGDFTIVNLYMMQITMPLNFLGTVYREIRQALVDMGEMFSLLEQPPEVVDQPDARQLEVKGGAIRFDDVRFGYDVERAILKGVSLDILPGQTVALVGHSGSGKSTIGRLLFRFYDVTGGGIEIDGQNLRDVTQESLRHAIGVVPQDTVLFNDTIGYNIAYGRPEATTQEVQDAARAAQIHDFIVSLPEGYDTKVGERGLKLSGGEKQRVGIARTILKNPPILLLDEATSALDTETEHDIQDSLREMGQGRTVITIAHRLSTVVHADRIVVLDHGEVVESGTHEALLAEHGRYARMWAQQAAEEEDA